MSLSKMQMTTLTSLIWLKSILFCSDLYMTAKYCLVFKSFLSSDLRISRSYSNDVAKEAKN